MATVNRTRYEWDSKLGTCVNVRFIYRGLTKHGIVSASAKLSEMQRGSLLGIGAKNARSRKREGWKEGKSSGTRDGDVNGVVSLANGVLSWKVTTIYTARRRCNCRCFSGSSSGPRGTRFTSDGSERATTSFPRFINYNVRDGNGANERKHVNQPRGEFEKRVKFSRHKSLSNIISRPIQRERQRGRRRAFHVPMGGGSASIRVSSLLAVPKHPPRVFPTVARFIAGVILITDGFSDNRK